MVQNLFYNLKCTYFIGCILICPCCCIIAKHPFETIITTHKEINAIEIERIFHFAQSKCV